MSRSRLVLPMLAALAAFTGPVARTAAGAPGELRVAVAGQPADLRVAAVQLRIEPADLASREAFRAHITGLVERCLPYAPGLILFPEYTSAFLALLPYGDLIGQAGSVEQALRRVQEREPLARSLRDLFLLHSGLAERDAQELFGGLAREHGVAVGAGSRFAAESSAGRTVLVNRAVIFDERGGELYAQDKVFLTPFEEDWLGLAPGRLEAARPFLVHGRRLALTLCRDTFFAEWESVLSEAELWVDLKANGEPFTAQAQEGFQRALPARLPGAGVPYGLTLCLTGSLAGLSWEGESSVVHWQPGGDARVLARAASPTGEDILYFTLPGPEAEAPPEGGKPPGPPAADAPCADPLAILRAFYDHNDAQRFEQGVSLLSPEAELATWATGVNGHIMALKRLRGREQILSYLPAARGLSRRLPGSPADGPIYRETQVSVAGDTVRFMLEPDRKRPNGRLYNPFSVEAQLEGCRIRSLTVIEHVTWL